MKNGRSRIKATVKAVNSTLSQIVARNDERNYLLIFNSGDLTAYIQVETGGFIDLPPHNGKEWITKVPINAFNAKTLGSDTTNISIWEA